MAVGTLRRDEGGWQRFHTSLAQAYVHGVTVDWRPAFAHARRPAIGPRVLRPRVGRAEANRKIVVAGRDRERAVELEAQAMIARRERQRFVLSGMQNCVVRGVA